MTAPPPPASPASASAGPPAPPGPSSPSRPSLPGAGRTRLPLRTKWTAALLLVGGLPLLLYAVASSVVHRRGLETAERAVQAAVAEQAAQHVRQILDEAAEAAHRVGQSLTEPGAGPPEARLARASAALLRSPELAGVAIYGPDARLIDVLYRKDAPAAERGPAPPESLPLPLPGTATEAGSWDVAWPQAPGSAGPLLRYREAVVRERETRAVVLGLLPAALLGARLRQIARDQLDADESGLLLLDGARRVLAGGSAAGPIRPGDSLDGRDLLATVRLPPEPPETADGTPARDLLLTAEFPGLSGEPMVGTLRTLKGLRWLLVVRRPASVAYGVLRDVRGVLLLAALLLLGAAVGLGRFLALRTTRPVGSLVALTRAYARRQFDARSDVRTGDELEELGRSLTEMAADLAQSEREIARRALVESSLSRFLSPEVARRISTRLNTGDSSGALVLGGERREVSVLFADVAAFTRFAESTAPERVVAFLNELFTVLTEVVFRHHGTVDKFLGDCVMAVFGAPTPQDDHAERALATAEDIHRFVEASAPAWQAKYGITVQLGIGINSGEALVGNLGSETRMEYTAIGDVVNVAARLEGVARPGQTLLTASVAARAGGAFELRSLGEHPLRGKRKPVEIYEMIP